MKNKNSNIVIKTRGKMKMEKSLNKMVIFYNFFVTVIKEETFLSPIVMMTPARKAGVIQFVIL